MLNILTLDRMIRRGGCPHRHSEEN
jgi:hypothetical protein